MASIRLEKKRMAYENDTIDVASKGCFHPFDMIACVRNGILLLFIAATLLSCFYRIFRLHYLRHPQIHQYIIFYFASFECILCIVNWFMGGSRPQFDIAASYVKLLEFIVMSHFYWAVAARILHKEHLVYRVIIPILSAYVLYFSSVAVYGIVSTKSSWTECLKNWWLMMSAAEFLIVQLFMLAGHYINVKINSVSAVESFKRAQKRDLWCLIIAFELSAFVSVVYDIIMKTKGNEKTGCSGIFGHNQVTYSCIFAIFMIMKFMVPIWMMLIVFKVSTTRLNESAERLAQCSTDDQARLPSVFKQRRSKNSSNKQVFEASINQDPRAIPEIYCGSRAMATGYARRKGSYSSQSSSGGSQSKLLPSIEEGHCENQ